jgi:hypothetical protein
MAMDINLPSSQSKGGLGDITMPPTIEPGATHKSRAYQLEMLEQSLRQNIIVTVN